MRLSKSVALNLVLIVGSLACVMISLAEAEDMGGAAGNGVSQQLPKIFDYAKYIDKFRKAYSPLETLRKAQLFFGRTLKIFQHNVMFIEKKVHYYLSQNAFTDMPADELRKHFSGQEKELAPVQEALTHPDQPANSLLSVRQMEGADASEGCSRSSLDELENNAKYDPKTNKITPMLNFMDNENIADMKIVLEQLKGMPDVAAQMANLVDIQTKEDARLKEEAKSLEQAKLQNSVEYKPVVESNNRNYEPQVAPSLAALNADEEPIKNYANSIFDASELSGLNMNPYPEYQGSTLKFSLPGKGKSSLGKILDSVKNFFSWEYDQWDEDGDTQMMEAGSAAPAEPVTPDPVTMAALEAIEAKYNVDWRVTGCISPVQNQRNCDSCYAFSVLSLMEYFYCRQTKKLTHFSAQYVVDCGSKANLNRCRASKISNVGKFIKSYGLELAANYPYVGLENQCPYEGDLDSSENQAKKSGYLRPDISHWQNFREMAAWYKWVRKSPIIVGISMPLDFLAYGGGVHDGLDCDPEMGHAMLLVGSGIQNGREFWLMKNSFSEDWGEAGYFKIAKSAPLRCFNSAIVARAKFPTRK